MKDPILRGSLATALAGAFLAGLFGFASAVNNDGGLIGCDIDGDGRPHVANQQKEVTLANGWTVASDGQSCHAYDISIPRIDAVDAVGRPLEGFTAKPL